MNHFDGHTKGRSYSTSSTSSSHSYNDSFYQRAPGSEREDFNQVWLSCSSNKLVKIKVKGELKREFVCCSCTVVKKKDELVLWSGESMQKKRYFVRII